MACFGVEAPWHELGLGLMRLGYLQPLDVPPHGIGHKLTAEERAKLAQALNEFIWQDVCGFGTARASLAAHGSTTVVPLKRSRPKASASATAARIAQVDARARTEFGSGS